MRLKNLWLSLTLICLLITLFGCSATPKVSEPQNTVTEQNTVTDEENNISPTDEASIVEAVRSDFDFSMPAFCAVQFSVDTDHSVTADYTPNHETTLELIDTAGSTWQLVIPPYSLSQPVTLKMTLLRDIKSTEVSALFSGGLLLEPDGLRFLTPATLHIENETPADTVLLTGSSQGENMNFVNKSLNSNTFEINHFSSLVATDTGSLRMSTTLSDLEKKVLENERQTMAMAKKFLKDYANAIEAPAPPALNMACEDESTQEASSKKLNKFLDDAYDPEGLLISLLLKARLEAENLGIQAINQGENQRLVDKLLYRLEKKALLLMDTYKGKSDYLLPITNFALKVAKDIALVGTREEWPDEKIKAQMGDWIATSLNDVIKKVKEEHDFRQMDVAVKVATWAGTLGTDISDQLWREIGKAMTFELKLQVLYKTSDSEHFIESILPISYVDLYFPLVLKGDGQPTYTFSTSVPDVSVTANPNPVHVSITEFNPCEGKGTLVLDQFYANAESMTMEEDVYPQNLTKRWWDFCYGDYKITRIDEETEFIFPFTLHNLNEIVANETIEGKNNSGGQMTIAFYIQLIHKPK